MGAAEIRRMLDVSRPRVYQITSRPDFPAPLATLVQGRIWDEDAVRAWIAAHRPLDSDDP